MTKKSKSGELVDFVLEIDADAEGVTEDFLPFSHLSSDKSARHFFWKIIHHGVITYRDVVMRISEDDVCFVTFEAHQERRFYTHLINRIAYTGPIPSVTLLDEHRVPVAAPLVCPQVNFNCGHEMGRWNHQVTVPGAFALTHRASFSSSGYRFITC